MEFWEINKYNTIQDKLFKISKINSIISGKFAEASMPFWNLHMRKQMSFRSKNCNPKDQLITLRLFVLCDVETGLVLNSVVQNTALHSKEEMELRQCSDCFHEAFASPWS